MKRGLLTKPWSIPPDAIGQKMPVITVDMECPDCHVCGLIIVDPALDLIICCHCVHVVMQRVL